MTAPDPDNAGVMSFGDHLDELRRRVLLALIPPIPLALVFFMLGEPIREWLCLPLISALRANGLPVQLQALSPIETIVLDLKLSIIFALVFSAPWILWQAWKFVAPGLYRHERRFVGLLLPGSGLLVIAGLALLYIVILPLMLTVLVSFGVTDGPLALPTPAPAEVADAPDAGAEAGPATGLSPSLGALPVLEAHPTSIRPGEAYVKVPENLLCVAVPSSRGVEVMTTALGRGTLIVQQYRLSEYIDFVLLLTAGIAVAFQLPLVMLLLGWMDVLRIETLQRNRKYALLVCAVIAAVVTPPDVVSMLLTLAPLYLLYEVGLLLMRLLPASRVAGAQSSRTESAARSSGPPRPTPARGSVARERSRR